MKKIFLLRRPLKAQVFCHRYARMEQLTLSERLEHGYSALPYPPGTRTNVRYTDTQAWLHDRQAWINAAQSDTVLVTPGISPGERDMKNIAINSRLPPHPSPEGTHPQKARRRALLRLCRRFPPHPRPLAR